MYVDLQRVPGLVTRVSCFIPVVCRDVNNRIKVNVSLISLHLLCVLIPEMSCTVVYYL